MRPNQISPFRPVPLLFIIVLLAAGLGQWSRAGLLTSSARPLAPGPNDPRIACVTALQLERLHYGQHPLDDKLSARFFDGYVNALDPRHENLLQSDLAEFARARTNLDRLTVGENGRADLSPAFALYNRYLERYREHTGFAEKLLQRNALFHFTSADTIQIDRRHAPFPKDLAEARQLWRQHLEYDCLQEKLARELTETNGQILIRFAATNATDIPRTIARHYREALRQTTNNDSDAVLSLYLNALAHAYDPHSDFFTAPKAADFSSQMSLSLFGIGAMIQEIDGYTTIGSLVAGGPAAKSGQLQEQDRIVAVAQGNQPPVDVIGMESSKVIGLVRGPKGTTVRLTLSPAADRARRKTVELVRDEIKHDEAAAKARVIEQPAAAGGTHRLGVLEVPSFYATSAEDEQAGHTHRSTADDVAKLIGKLKQEHVAGIILDLRSNLGGALDEAVRLTGLFTKGGPVVLVRSGNGQTVSLPATNTAAAYDGPLAVLVNRYSASAAEITAAALQDYGRAVVVGDTSTFGKGTVQRIFPLKPYVRPANPAATNDPGEIKITIAKFSRVTGDTTQFKGVIPDIVLPDPLSYSQTIGENALDNPLPGDAIPPVRFQDLNLVRPSLMELSRRSAARLATNQDFANLREDIADQQKHAANPTATLNEHQAIEERRTTAARNQARTAERDARPASQTKVYEITLADLNKPLPEYQYDAAAGKYVADLKQPAPNTAAAPALTTGAKKTAPDLDPTLDESGRILEDYLRLHPRNDQLADGH